jgi:hypothetical protein
MRVVQRPNKSNTEVEKWPIRRIGPTLLLFITFFGLVYWELWIKTQFEKWSEVEVGVPLNTLRGSAPLLVAPEEERTQQPNTAPGDEQEETTQQPLYTAPDGDLDGFDEVLGPLFYPEVFCKDCEW